MRMRKEITLLSLFFLVSGMVFAGGGGQSSAQAVKEAAAPKSYPPSFTAKGSAAAAYNQKLDYVINETIKNFTASGQGAKITGYETPVKVRVALLDNAGIQTSLAAWKEMYGETIEINRFTDAFKRLYNADVELKFASNNYNQQIRLDMASNDLPDIFWVTSQKDIIDMAQAGVIQEIGSYRQKYASKQIEEIWTSGDSPLWEMTAVDGKYYGIPRNWPVTDYFSYLWLRSDWLQALNLQPPKTMDDLTKILEAFANADFDKNGVKDTIGLGLQKNLFSQNYRGIFSAFGAYPEYWIIKNGALLWGGVDNNVKNALAYLNSLYKKGLIDKEFISYGDSDMFEAFINGKAGALYSWHGMANSLYDLHNKDSKADFWAVPLPTGNGKAVTSPMYPMNVGWTVVNSKFKNPELAYKFFNLFASAYNSKDGAWWTFDNPVGGGAWSDVLGYYGTAYSALLNYDAYEGLLASKKAGWDESKLNAAAMIYYGPINTPSSKWAWDRLCNPDLPNNAFARLKEMMDNKLYFYDAFLGVPSNYMADRWQAIQDEAQVAFTKIIVGDVGLDEGFAAWIRTFDTMGGQQITKEVNDWYKAQKK